MKFKRLTAVLAAMVMSLSMVTAASAEDVSYDDSTAYVISDTENSTAAYAATKTLDQLKAEFPDGSYYSKTGKACSCHDAKSNPCYWDDSCDCINYDVSIQCAAFAKYVFYNLRGYKWDNGTTTWLSISNVTGTTAKNALYGVPAGTYVLVKPSADSYKEHSLSIVGTTSTTVTVYDANSGKYRSNGEYYTSCRVRYTTLKWEEFANQYGYIAKIVK